MFNTTILKKAVSKEILPIIPIFLNKLTPFANLPYYFNTTIYVFILIGKELGLYDTHL